MTALIRLLSSTPFRLTLAYMGAFVVAAALIVGFIAWRANDLLTNNGVDNTDPFGFSVDAVNIGTENPVAVHDSTNPVINGAWVTVTLLTREGAGAGAGTRM